jgi:hypothetical protein
MMHQAQSMQLGPMVINALNALQGPLVLPGMGGVIGVDGITQNVQIPQLTVSNVIQVCSQATNVFIFLLLRISQAQTVITNHLFQGDTRNFLSQQQAAALLSPPDSALKKKANNKKRKTSGPQTVAVQISSQQQPQQPPNIAPAFNSTSSVSIIFESTLYLLYSVKPIQCFQLYHFTGTFWRNTFTHLSPGQKSLCPTSDCCESCNWDCPQS